MKKRIVSFLIILIIIILTAMLLGFVPKWKYSIPDFKFTNTEIELEVGDYENNLLENEQRKSELNTIDQELKLVQSQAPDLSKYEAKFHYPSLIILLEEEAIKRELLLKIHHDQIQHISHMITPENPKEEVEDEKEVKEKEEVSEKTEKDTGETERNISSQRGVDITVIPISIKGEYDSIRDYIVFLEEKDYITVDSYSIAGDKTNKADIKISVFSVIID